jgi:dynein heavy chain 1
MGSPEGFGLADQAIATATKTGSWVLLKNVHLALSWLGQLDKRLHSLKANPNFRLFLTMETNPKVPVNMLRLSRVLMFEPQPGIKANLQESLRGIPSARANKGPTERARLYFMVAWLHAVILERLRYVPLGWTKTYEFNDSDQDCALNTIDAWLDTVGQGRANVSPDRIPWDAIRALLCQSVYGGRVDTEKDQQLLESFVGSFFRAECYDLNYKLVETTEDDPGLVAPEGTKITQFLQWVSELPEREPPTWLRLPATAERVLSTHKAVKMLSKVKKIKGLVDDDGDEQ